ncbi:hypothetical protein ACTFIY_006832 [Dictyostelium cf. discoideum]
MRVLPVLVNQDNYSYLVIDEKNKVAVSIDPCEPNKVISALSSISSDIKLDSVFTTHHHWDHAGGNNLIKTIIKDINVYGRDERFEGITKKLENNEVLKIGSLKIKTLDAPAHTSSHVLYLIEDENEPNQVKSLFTGDTLFIGGCGRLFEGNPEQMYNALYNVIGKLPDDTLVYVGHEYTLKNLEFAKTLESVNENKELYNFYDQCKEKLANGKFTVPSSIAQEKLINPFMRCHLPSIYNHYLKENPTSINPPSPIDVLGFIRSLKDKF